MLNAGREVEDAIVVFLRSQEQAQHLDASVVAAARTVEITKDQYNQGVVDFTAVYLFSKTTLTEQQDQLAVAQGDIALGLIAVYRSLGGGWQIRLGGDSAAGRAHAVAAAGGNAVRPKRSRTTSNSNRSPSSAHLIEAADVDAANRERPSYP